MLKQKHYEEAAIGLLMTMFVTIFKNNLLNKSSNSRALLIAGVGWAIHYLMRKFIMSR